MINNKLLRVFWGILFLTPIVLFGQNKKGISVNFSKGDYSFCFGSTTSVFNVTVVEKATNTGAFGNTGSISTNTVDSITINTPQSGRRMPNRYHKA